MRVYFDASVIIAALLSPDGGSSLLFTFIKQGAMIGITSQTVVEEVLEEDKPAKIKKTAEEIEAFIASSRLVVREAVTEQEIEPLAGMIDREDAHLIAGARSTQCTHLVTLDKKHLLRRDIAQRFLPLRIVSPKQLVEEIVSR